MPKLKSKEASSKTAKPVPKASTEKYSLPEERSVVLPNLSDYSILLYGQEKIGKTDLARRFGNPLFLMFEPGARAIPVYQREINKWGDLVAYLKLLGADRSRFSTVVWDTIDLAYDMCLRHVCEEEGFDHPGDEKYGKGWNKVKAEFVRWVNFSLKLGRGVIFTSHAADKEIKSKITGEKYNRIQPTMAGQARGVVEALVDIWMYAHFADNGKRVIRIVGNEDIAAGHRLQENFIGVETISMGRNSKEAYANLLDAFNNHVIMGKPESSNGGKKKSFKLRR